MKGMKKYYTQKIMWYLLTLVFAVLLNFILPRLMPGDPVSTIASKSVEGMTDATAIQKVYEDYAAKFGINKPMYVQFFTWEKMHFAVISAFLSASIRVPYPILFPVRFCGPYVYSFRPLLLDGFLVTCLVQLQLT